MNCEFFNSIDINVGPILMTTNVNTQIPANSERSPVFVQEVASDFDILNVAMGLKSEELSLINESNLPEAQ